MPVDFFPVEDDQGAPAQDTSPGGVPFYPAEDLVKFSLGQALNNPLWGLLNAGQYSALTPQERTLERTAVPPEDLAQPPQMPFVPGATLGETPRPAPYSGLPGAVQFGREQAGAFTQAGGEMLSDLWNKSPLGALGQIQAGQNAIDTGPLPLTTIPGSELFSSGGVRPIDLVLGKGTGQGIDVAGGKFISGFTDPSQAWLAPFWATKPVQALFGAEALAGVPESIQAIYQAKTPAERGEAIGGAGLNLAIGVGIGANLMRGESPYASRIREAEKVYGDLRSRALEGPGQVPTEEGGAGVQPQAQDVAQRAQVPLTIHDPFNLLQPEHNDALNSAATELGLKGVKIEVQPTAGWYYSNPEVDPTHRMTAWAEYPSLDKDGNFVAPGKIHISAAGLEKLDSLFPDNPERKQAALRRIVQEEVIHSFTTLNEAKGFLDTLTETEKKSLRDLYWGGAEEKMTPGQEGSEAIRIAIQRLMGDDPTEVGWWEGKYKIKPRMVELFATIIRRVREFFGTQAATQGREIMNTILDRMEQNTNKAAKSAGIEAPFPEVRASRLPEEERGGEELPEILPGERLVTVQRPDGSTYTASFGDKYWDLGKGKTASIGRPVAGNWSHGMLRPGENIIERGTPEVRAARRPQTTEEEIDKSTYAKLSSVAENVSKQWESGKVEKRALDFDKFYKALQKDVGQMDRNTALSAYEQGLWRLLLNASGGKLEAIIRSEELLKEVGDKPIGDPAPRSMVGAAEETPEQRTGRVARDRRRGVAISAIARKLLSEAVERGEERKTQVEPTDLYKSKRKTTRGTTEELKQPIYNELGNVQGVSPDKLGQVLTDDAGDASRRTVSETRRVTVIQNNATGKVDVVSTFRDGRRGPVMLDPMSPDQSHSKVESMLKRYQPVASILLDKPVKNFRQSYDSLADYENQFGKPAREGASKPVAELPGEAPIEGAYSRDIPITDAEAGALLDHLLSEAGKIESPADVKASLDAIGDTIAHHEGQLRQAYKVVSPELPLSAGSRMALNAYRKLAQQLEKVNPPGTSAEEIIDQLANNLYEAHKTSGSYEDFVRNVLAQGGPEARQAAAVGPQAPAVSPEVRAARRPETEREGWARGLTRATERGAKAGFINLQIVQDLVDKTTPYVKGALNAIREIGRESQTLGKMTDYRRAVLNWSGKLQQSFYEAAQAQKNLQRVIPDAARRAGVTNWIQADGDRTVLAQRLAQTRAWRDPVTGKPHPQAKKLIAGYEAALTLSRDEINAANEVRDVYKTLAQRGQNYDVLKTFKDNYVTQLWNLGKTLAGAGITGGTRTLREKMRFSRASTFDSYFAGEQAGFVPKTKDISKILPVYIHEMNTVIAARQLVEELSKGTASDGRPLVVPRDAGIPVKGPSGSATLIMPKVRPETRDYRMLANQPALNDWIWANKDAAGNNIFNKSDLVLHPEAYNRLKDVLGRSAIREWYSTRTSALAEIPKVLVKALDMANSETKRTMLGLLAIFHQAQEATHAGGHRVNPLFNIPKVDLVNDIGQRTAVRSGLMMLPDRASENQFMEGFRTSGLISRIPGVGTLADWYSNYLFKEYIPGLKYKTYQAILRRNRGVFANEIAARQVSVDDVRTLSAEQTNAAFGHLNYADLARNPTVQHLAQLGLLAPDFLEARSRFAGQAIKGLTGAKVGREQLLALATLAIGQAALAYTAAKLTDGEWDPSRPFEFIHGKRRYTMRSVPEDISALLHDTRMFIHSRLSPLIGKGGWQYLTGVDYRGQKVSAAETTKELATQPLPISIRGFLGIGKSNLSGLEQLAGAVGLKISPYETGTRIYEMSHDWMKKSADPKMLHKFEVDQKQTFGESDYKPIRKALDAGDLKGSLEAYKKLLEEGKKRKDIFKAMQPWTYSDVGGQLYKHYKPFAGLSHREEQRFSDSLNPQQREIFIKARKERAETFRKFLDMLRQLNQASEEQRAD